MKKTIILDIDFTLIVTLPITVAECFPKKPNHRFRDLAIYERPYLQEFMDFCFSQFDAVGIWTNGDATWANVICTTVLGRDPKDFAFVWDRSYSDYMEHVRSWVKNLEKVWLIPRYREMGFTPNCTLIVEDTPSNCIMNIKNSIIVKRAILHADEEDIGEVDCELFDLAEFLTRNILPHTVTNVRSVELRGWQEEFW